MRNQVCLLLSLIIFCTFLLTPPSPLEGAPKFACSVRVSQEALKREGLDPGSADGVWGMKTAFAVQAYQSFNGLNVSATLDAATCAALLKEECPPGQKVVVKSQFAMNKDGAIIGMREKRECVRIEPSTTQ